MLSPDWIIREIEHKDGPLNIVLDKNSGLVCSGPENEGKIGTLEKCQLEAIGMWSNETWDYVRLIRPMAKITQRIGVKIHENDKSKFFRPNIESSEDYHYEHIERREPAEITWNPDFKLICLDRDVLISRKCLIKFSKVLESALEKDKECESLEIPWRSKGIIYAMDMIHSSRCIQLCRVFVSTGSYTQDMLEFCFKYDIGFVLSALRKSFMDLIPRVERTISWLPFLHKFNNPDGTCVFEDEINAIISSIDKPSRVEKYLELRSGKMSDDYTKHDHDIMRMMAGKLNSLNECD